MRHLLTNRNLWLILPYAAWMLLQMTLPRTAGTYALRGAVTAALLIPAFFVLRPARLTARQFLWGVVAGLIVLAVWLAPGSLLATGDMTYAPTNCGWPLTLAKLLASAFVIAAAEELFFRKWLVEFAGFGWMIVLFAVEHSRWESGLIASAAFIAEGAFAGYVYGELARRRGLWCAIVAHVITNFALGLWVILRGAWQFW